MSEYKSIYLNNMIEFKNLNVLITGWTRVYWIKFEENIKYGSYVTW